VRGVGKEGSGSDVVCVAGEGEERSRGGEVVEGGSGVVGTGEEVGEVVRGEFGDVNGSEQSERWQSISSRYLEVGRIGRRSRQARGREGGRKGREV